VGEYNKEERRAIGTLSVESSRIFKILEGAEHGRMLGIPELCSVLGQDPTFIAFSCLSGDQIKRELGDNLGSLFTERKIRISNETLVALGTRLTVFVDDTEPVRIWGWPTQQQEITDWCRLVVESSTLPPNWDIALWSETEQRTDLNYEGVLETIKTPEHALLVNRRLAHMKEFPNRKIKNLKGKGLENAAIQRVAQYALQGLVLEKLMPRAVLLQAETPWAVKDPLYQPLRRSPLPIVHPFEERR
jgi:hypothetical protein